MRMPEYRRSRLQGGTYFFTVVTFNRIPIFNNKEAIGCFREAWKRTQEKRPFITEAFCLLPNHMHCLWTLPKDDCDYSLRWREIKRLFTRDYGNMIGINDLRNESRINRDEATIWQRRFWEHTIRDQTDFNTHVDYIHFNPVKHGYVKNVSDWEWSTFHRYVQMGLYENNWGRDVVLSKDGMFGEQE